MVKTFGALALKFGATVEPIPWPRETFLPTEKNPRLQVIPGRLKPAPMPPGWRQPKIRIMPRIYNAIALVGSRGTVATAATTSVSPTFAQATTAGNLLTAHAIGTGTTNLGGVTTTGSGWVAAIQQTPGTATSSAIWYKPNCGASETAPTFTCTAATFMAARLIEWSGAATSSPVDQTGSTVLLNIINSAQDTGTGRLLISAWTWTNSKSATYTITDSYNQGATATTTNSGATKQAFAWDFVDSATGMTTTNSGADTDTNTITPSTGTLNEANGVMASFQPAPTSFPYVRRYPLPWENLPA